MVRPFTACIYDRLYPLLAFAFLILLAFGLTGCKRNGSDSAKRLPPGQSPSDQFLSLMQSNPRIAHSLIESMARRIDLMNKEVTQLRAQLQPA